MSRAAQLSAFADTDPANPILLCDLLDELLSAGDLDGVAARLDVVPPALRESPGVRFREARSALLRGHHDTAIGLLQPLLTAMQDVPVGVVHDLAYAQFVQGRPDDAMHTLTQVSYEGDDAVLVALLKAKILHGKQQHVAALDVLQPLVSGAHQAAIHGARALLWLDHGDAVQASIEAEQALLANPDQHEAGIANGTVALWAQRIDESMAAFQHVLDNHPGSGRAWHGLGQATLLRGVASAARVQLVRASIYMPDHVGTWHTLAWCQLVDSDLAGARNSFERAFALDRTFGETHGGFAVVHAMRGERKDAEDSIKRAVRLDPRGRSARYAQSLLLFAEGRIDEARKIVNDLRVRIPGRGESVSADFIFSSCVGLPVAEGEHG